MNRKVKSEMALKGLTSREVAREIGCSETWFSLVINGHRKSPRVRKAIAETLGVSYKSLWGNGNGAA